MRTKNGNSSKTKFEVQDKPCFRRRFSNKELLDAPMVNKSKVSTLNSQEGNDNISYVKKHICPKYYKRHHSKFLVGTVISMVVARLIT